MQDTIAGSTPEIAHVFVTAAWLTMRAETI